MQGPESSERAVCAEHGLRYDPRVSSGCVLCRKRSVPAAGMPAAPRTTQSATKSIMLVVAGLVGLAALFGLYGVVKVLSEARQVRREQEERQVTHVSADELVSLSVPATWRRLTSGLGAGTLILHAPGDVAAITIVDEARPMEPHLTLEQYLERLNKSYRQPGTNLTMKRIDPPAPFEIDGRRGLRVSWKGIGAQNNDVAGYLYVVQSSTHFHQFLTIAVDAYFPGKKAEFDGIVGRAKLNVSASVP